MQNSYSKLETFSVNNVTHACLYLPLSKYKSYSFTVITALRERDDSTNRQHKRFKVFSINQCSSHTAQIAVHVQEICLLQLVEAYSHSY